MSSHPIWGFCIISASRWLTSQFSYHPVSEFYPPCAPSWAPFKSGWCFTFICCWEDLTIRDSWSLSCFLESNLGSHWTPILLLSSAQSHWSSFEVSVTSYLASPSCLKNEVSFRPHSRSERTEDWIIKQNHISQSLVPFCAFFHQYKELWLTLCWAWHQNRETLWKAKLHSSIWDFPGNDIPRSP